MIEFTNLAVPIHSTIGSNKKTIASTPVDRYLVLLDLQLIVDLNSIAEMPNYEEDPLLSEEQKLALFWQLAHEAPNKQVTTWFNNGTTETKLVSFLVMNRQPYYTENLLERFTSLDQLLLQPGATLKLSIEDSNSGLLAAGDLLTVWGVGYYTDDLMSVGV